MTAHDKQQTPSPSSHLMGSEAREIIARFIAEGWARRHDSGLTADYYMSIGTPHEQADELLERLSSTNAEKRVEQINPDRSKFPYRWEGPRPPEAIIHKVINAYMGEDPHEHDNSQFLYHLANWESYYTLNQRMKTAMEAENAVCEATDGVATDLDNTEIFNESR